MTLRTADRDRPAGTPSLRLIQGGVSSRPALEVGELLPAFEGAWDEYVRRHPDGTFFHLLGWKRAVERSFGHRSHYLLARRRGKVTGVLPLFHLESLLFGRSLVSVPFAVRGGVLADDPQTAAVLLERARELVEELGVDYLELRSERPLEGDLAQDLADRALYVTFKADLRLSEEALLRRMERKRRQMMTYVGKPEAGYEAHFVGPEELPAFYELFCLGMRSHGTPVYPRRFLEEILRQSPQETGLYFAYHRGTLVAAVLNLFFGDTVLPFYAGVDRSRRPRGLDDFLYWSLMLWARSEGYRTFDFGRSRRDTGPYRFKVRWGMEEVPLGYQYLLGRSGSLPSVNPSNPRYQLLIRTWRRLPLAVTKLLGPPIARRVP